MLKRKYPKHYNPELHFSWNNLLNFSHIAHIGWKGSELILSTSSSSKERDPQMRAMAEVASQSSASVRFNYYSFILIYSILEMMYCCKWMNDQGFHTANRLFIVRQETVGNEEMRLPHSNSRMVPSNILHSSKCTTSSMVIPLVMAVREWKCSSLPNPFDLFPIQRKRPFLHFDRLLPWLMWWNNFKRFPNL